jgi:hypothetical protein
MNMQLKYYVPFKAQGGQDAQLAVKENLINIEGVAIDTSVNTNKWQVPEEDLDFFVSSLQGAQLRIDHAESAMAVIGKVPESKRLGSTAWFRAEIGEASIIAKVLRGYLTHVSVQVDSDDVECSKCGKQTRKEGMLVHLCPGAWEVVHKPKVRELSIVASPAYQTTEFKPVGFAAAMDASQEKAHLDFKRKSCIQRLLAARLNLTLSSLQSSKSDEDVGSRGDPQEPENQNLERKEVKPMSTPQSGQPASPHQAQGVVNVAPGEGAPKQVTYEELTNQVTKLIDQIKSAGTDAEVAELGKKVAEIEAEVAKRATKTALTRKLTELSKKMSESASDAEDARVVAPAKRKGESGEDADAKTKDDDEAPEQAEASQAAGKAKGKGMISNEDMEKENIGPSAPWFKDLLHANADMQKSGRTTFVK